MRKNEYFKADYETLYGKPIGTVLATVQRVFAQERDWTCSIACLRTLLSSTGTPPAEDDIVKDNDVIAGPKNSAAIKSWKLADSKDVIYGCDKPFKDGLASNLTELMKDYNVMVECMINYAHWIVLLSYVDLGDLEQDIITYYDPYYNRVNTIIADEFLSMWYDVSDNPLHHDYVAIRKD